MNWKAEKELKKFRKRAIFARDSWQCLYCGRRVDETVELNNGTRATIDHVWAKSLANSTDSPRNMMTCCQRCNSQKEAKDWRQFVNEKGFNFHAVWDRLQSRRDTKIEAWWKISGLKHYIKEREDAVSIEGGKTMSYIKLIPENTKYSLDAYANKEHPTGGFLQAVLENNLMEAVARADDFNVRALKEICMYIYNELPSQCHGSKEKVAAWVRSMYEDDKCFQTMGVSDDK